MKKAGLVTLCMIDGIKQAKVCKFYWPHLRQILRGVGKSQVTQNDMKLRECLSGKVPELGTRDTENQLI